jgi:hypothetical protein
VGKWRENLQVIMASGLERFINLRGRVPIGHKGLSKVGSFFLEEMGSKDSIG